MSLLGPRRLLALLAVTGTVAVATGCGVPNDSSPRLIAGEDRAALVAPTTTVAVSLPAEPPANVVTVYLLDPSTGTLKGVSREVPSTEAKDRVQALLDLVLSPAEQQQGLLSQIPPETELLGTSMDGFDLVIDLSKDFTVVTAGAGESAVAQLVYTATEGRSVTGVRFSVDHILYDVPGEDGVTKPSLRRADFRGYDPAGAAPTTTTAAPTSTTIDSPGRR